MFWTKNQNRKWHARPQLYKGRFFYLKRVGQVLMGILVVVALVSLFLYFRNSSALGIQKVEVLGNLAHLSRDDVIKLSDIKRTDKLFTIDLNTIQENILRFAWVKEVRVRREFPSTIQIHITERRPMAILLAGDRYFLDDEGVVFKRVQKGDSQDLPVLTGFNKDLLKKYPQLMKSFLNFCTVFQKFIETQNFYKSNPISEIHFDPVFGLTVYTLNNSLEIYYGRDSFRDKQRKLEKFKLSKYFEDMAFVRLDLDSQDKVVARYVKRES